MPSLTIGLGKPQDWIIIAVILLIAYGPKRLTEMGKELGQARQEFREAQRQMFRRLPGAAFVPGGPGLLLAGLLLLAWLGALLAAMPALSH